MSASTRQLTLALSTFIIGTGAASAQTSQTNGPATEPFPERHAVLASTAAHETSKGTFIDPLITEHAFVDRKVRTDLAVRLLREGEGQAYVNQNIFEYAFTRWFSLEIAQPFVLIDPEAADSETGIGDLTIGAKFQLTRATDTNGLIVAAGVETSLPSGEEAIGAGEEYVLAPLAGVDWAIGSGLFKLQTQAELEIAFPRQAGDGTLEALEWNSAVSYFASPVIVPLVELNAEIEGLEEEETESIYAVTPGVVISLADVAGKSFDVAAGAQLFFGSDREADVALLVSLRHHWQLVGMGGVSLDAH